MSKTRVAYRRDEMFTIVVPFTAWHALKLLFSRKLIVLTRVRVPFQPTQALDVMNEIQVVRPIQKRRAVTTADEPAITTAEQPA